MPVREPCVAGTFYPADSATLRRFCQTHLHPSASPIPAKAIILPHAGYVYSGQTACKVLSKVHVPERNFLIGPNHRGVGAPFAVAASGEWKTPLGRVPIDSETASSFLEMSHDLSHDDEAHSFEHSLEVEIPLLQTRQPRLKIVPLIVGTLDLDRAREVALTCGYFLASFSESFLVVVSTDMSHYESDQATRKKDQYALNAIENLDAEALVKAVSGHHITMCGFIPVYMLLVMKEALGIQKATLVEYTTSAEASGDYERVVGYAGFIFE